MAGFIDFAAKTAASIRKTLDRIDDRLDDSDAYNALRSVPGQVARAAVRVKRAGQRVVKGYSDEQVFDFGTSELKLIARKLHEFALHDIGYPDDYSDYLKPRREGWEKALAPLKAMESYQREYADAASSSDDGFMPLPSCERCGLAYSAWLEDIDYAADVIGAYADFNDGIDEQMAVVGMFGDEEWERRHDMLEKEFRRVWAWLGRNINGIWW